MNNNIIFAPPKWYDYYYKINNHILTHQHIADSLTSLFTMLRSNNNNIPSKSVILIQFKIKIDIHNIDQFLIFKQLKYMS